MKTEPAAINDVAASNDGDQKGPAVNSIKKEVRFILNEGYFRSLSCKTINKNTSLYKKYKVNDTKQCYKVF